MSHPVDALIALLPERLRTGMGRRATGFFAALALEALLILLLLTLGQGAEKPGFAGSVVTTFDAGSEPEEDKSEAEPEPTPKKQQAQVTPQEPAPQEAQPLPMPPAPQQPQSRLPTQAFIPLSRDQMASVDISNLPKSPAPAAASKPAYGPPDTGTPGDTPRVGTAPNGKPLYAAAWYRKPYDSELAGYLSTAQGPGWGLIACKTAPEYRVEDCVAEGESPDHSNIARAVLAAAWQFRVRPPRVGGKELYGEWVRIRIDYQINKR